MIFERQQALFNNLHTLYIFEPSDRVVSRALDDVSLVVYFVACPDGYTSRTISSMRCKAESIIRLENACLGIKRGKKEGRK